MKSVNRISISRVQGAEQASALVSLLVAGLFHLPLALGLVTSAHAFEGRITAALTRGGETQTFTYTVGTSTLRIERNETDRPYPGNLVALETGTVTLLFPHNRSFIRLKPPSANATPSSVPMTLPAGRLPPGIGPTTLPPTRDSSLPQIPRMPAAPHGAGMPAGLPGPPMMPMPEETMELKATGEKADFLGYACARYEIKQRGEILEIWATDTLMPFQPYLQKRHARFRSQLMEECWGDLMKTKKIFPLRVTLRSENGVERLRFEVKTIRSEKIDDRDSPLFQIPDNFHEQE